MHFDDSGEIDNDILANKMLELHDTCIDVINRKGIILSFSKGINIEDISFNLRGIADELDKLNKMDCGQIENRKSTVKEASEIVRLSGVSQLLELHSQNNNNNNLN